MLGVAEIGAFVVFRQITGRPSENETYKGEEHQE